jgi:hypothetical protein
MHIAGLPRLSGAAARKLERLQAAAAGAMHGSIAAQELAAFVSAWSVFDADPAALAECAEAEERAAEQAAAQAKAQAEAEAKANAELEEAAKAKTAKAAQIRRSN